MHLALARETQDPAFAPEPIKPSDWASLQQSMDALAGQSLDLLARVRPSLPDDAAALADTALARRTTLAASFERLAPLDRRWSRRACTATIISARCCTVKNDYYILDFEGEPARSREQRREKRSPLKDVAGHAALVQLCRPMPASCSSPSATASPARC